MSKKILKKSVKFIFLFLILRFLLVIGLNYLNVGTSHYIDAINNEVHIDKDFKNYLYTIGNVKTIDDDSKIIYIESDNKREVSILIGDLTFLHEIYINDELISQNTDETKPHYDSDYAYKTFDINNHSYIDNKVKIQVKGLNASDINIFLANDFVMEDSKEIRTICYTIMLMILFMITVTSIIICTNISDSRYFLMFVIIGIVSIIKSINLGEVFVIAKAFGMTACTYTFIDNITSIINTLLPTFLMLYLFDIKIKAKYKIMTLILSVIFIYFSLFYNRIIVLYICIFLMTINAIIIAWSFIKDKAFCNVILINSVIYSSFAVYEFKIYDQSYKNGNLGFFINTAYLGAIMYLSGFLAVFIFKHIKEIKILKDKQEEYERITLLRGIGHDLKLPLSVIKLNNQMLEKYDMVDEENKEYVETSIKAILELEKMTDNINSYINIGKFNKENYTTSIKESFETLKNYYDIYNRNKNNKFIVVPDKKDYILHIKPSEFHRMLYNLVDNAIKYNKENGEVKVSYKIDKKVIITVEDTGIGMEKEQIDKIFTPFYRIDNSRTKEGLGLGLSVVKAIVDSLKGDIRIESKKDIGTKIIIHIPKI